MRGADDDGDGPATESSISMIDIDFVPDRIEVPAGEAGMEVEIAVA